MGLSVITTTSQQRSSSSHVAAAALSRIQERQRPSLPCRWQRHAQLRSGQKGSMTCAKMASSGGNQQHHPFNEEKGRSSENPGGFHPSLWGDFFVHYKNRTTPMQQIWMEDRADKLKKEVAKMISSSCNMVQRLQLIYALERLCLYYLFEEEINGVLAQIKKVDISNCDLHTVALWFYLLRIHRHKVSPDVFATFKDEDGRFAWHHPRDLLSLYNAACLRTHGETILDEALSFSKRELKSMMPYLEKEGPFAREINRALDIPIPKRVPIYEAKHYISIYEKDNTVDGMILELAKLNSDLLQIQHQQELKHLTWKGGGRICSFRRTSHSLEIDLSRIIY